MSDSPVHSRSAAKPRGRRAGVQDSTRRAEILATASQVFADRGYANTSVRDIGAECGILSGSLYHHFLSKDAMLLEILERSMDGLLVKYLNVKVSTDDSRARLRNLFEVALSFVAYEPNVARILQNEFNQLKHIDTFRPLLNRYNEIRKVVWRDVLDQSVEEGLIRSDFDLDMAYRIIMGAVLSAVHWLNPDGEYSIGQIADQYTIIIIDGLHS
ncbi:TetR/AcrR family transcriptional regulator [Nocardia sp. NPDC050799]|uniref:TetR/AcrR family transcriptional regulator n=1 Tax=Nocardia sp. NPDC050799 TaxID=3154842 RepID=UPI0033FCC840